MIGNGIGLDDNNIYGADIPSWGDYSEIKRTRVPINIVNLHHKRSMLPFTDNKFSLITTFMVLHHIKNLNTLLSEINIGSSCLPGASTINTPPEFHKI